MKHSSRAAELLQRAVALHKAGKLGEAEMLYRDVLKIDKQNPDALNLLGVMAQAQGDLAKAEAYLRRALANNPNAAQTYFNFGVVLAQQSKDAEAHAAYRQAVALDPKFADAYLNMGAVLYRMERFEDALTAFRKVVEIRPEDAGAYFNMAQCLGALLRLEDYEDALKRALGLAPTYADARAALASLYTKLNRLEGAIEQTRLLIQAQPLPGYYSNLGDLLRRVGLMDAALEAHRVAFTAQPDDPLVLHNYGAALHEAERYAEAHDLYTRIIAAHPRFMEAHIGLAKVYEQRGEAEKAVATLQNALVIQPDSATVKFKLTLRYLAFGSFREGWLGYEERFVQEDMPAPKHPEPPAYWAGEDLTAKTLWIWTEQGIGDEILYAGMVEEIAARCERCVLECSPRMKPVFTRSFPGIAVVTKPSRPVEADYQIAIASLGRYLRPNFESFPPPRAYLKADPAHAAALRARYCGTSPGNLVVGLSWRGRKDLGAMKNTELSDWAEILCTPGVTFVNLQYGDCTRDIAAAAALTGTAIINDLEIDPLRDMDAFFDQVAAMDLVISTSNTTVHVAGSLGIPTWLLSSGRSGMLWYWFLGRSDSPWYESVRIYRGGGGELEKRHSWNDAIAAAAASLRRLRGLK